MDKLAYMTPPFESEIRAQLIRVLGAALRQPPEPAQIRLPARDAHASFRPPQGSDAITLVTLDFGFLYGAPLLDSVRVVNGWLLFDFSPAFCSALVDCINRTLPEPTSEDETHAENRMRALARHSGEGCPDLTAFRRALVLALVAGESPAVQAAVKLPLLETMRVALTGMTDCAWPDQVFSLEAATENAGG